MENGVQTKVNFIQGEWERQESDRKKKKCKNHQEQMETENKGGVKQKKPRNTVLHPIQGCLFHLSREQVEESLPTLGEDQLKISKL